MRKTISFEFSLMADRCRHLLEFLHAKNQNELIQKIKKVDINKLKNDHYAECQDIDDPECGNEEWY